jgi:hypothetical protein
MTAEAGRLRANHRATGPWAPLFPGLAGGAEASLCTSTGRQAGMARLSNGADFELFGALGLVWCLLFVHFHPSVLQLPGI